MYYYPPADVKKYLKGQNLILSMDFVFFSASTAEKGKINWQHWEWFGLSNCETMFSVKESLRLTFHSSEEIVHLPF